MRRSSPARGVLLAAPLLLFLLLAFVVPLAHLVPAALAPPAVGAAGHGGSFVRAFLGPGLGPFENSLLISSVVSVAAVVLCLPAAWMLARHRFRLQGLLRSVLALPLTFSGVIVGFLAILVLGRLGLVPALLRLATGAPLLAGSAYTLGGLVTAYVYFEVPRAVLTLEAALRRLPPELDRAAATLGAGALRRLVAIHLPLVWPALVSTFAVAFAASMGSFGVALILARRFTVVPLEIYTEFTGFLDTGYASALCLGLAAVTLAANGLLRAVTKSEEWIYG